MKPQFNELQKAQAFDSYCKKILKYAARDYYEKKRRQGDREASLSGLTDKELLQIAVTDKYFTDEYAFDVLGGKVSVTDYELAEALSELTVDWREIVLLAYFLDMTDKEIAERLSLARSTVAYRRTSSLKKLRKILEEREDGTDE